MKKLWMLVMLALLAMPVVSVLAKQDTITVEFNQAQLQWRGVSPFGVWTPGYSYDVYATSADIVVTGNVLRTSWSYSPLVADLHGNQTVYVYDKILDIWIENEGHVKYVYTPGYGDSKVVNFFRGYMNFGGNEPSTANFVHGVAYQWAYLYVPEGTDLSGSYTPNAVWDSTVGAYLVGFSIYLWDPSSQGYSIAFPTTFPEPIPANDYNPLGL